MGTMWRGRVWRLTFWHSQHEVARAAVALAYVKPSYHCVVKSE
jgi:hypothetical protein